MHTLAALRIIQANTLMVRTGAATVLIQPAMMPNELSILCLPEVTELLSNPGVQHTLAALCSFGCPSTRLTSFVTHGVDYSQLPSGCTHTLQLCGTSPVQMKHG